MKDQDGEFKIILCIF